ncbi:MAG: c-type cytochrome [Gemmataceae bacterium]
MRRYLLSSVLFLSCASFPGQLPAAEEVPIGVQRLVQLLERVAEPAIQRDVLRGMSEAYKGQRQAPMPVEWPRLARKLAHSPDAEVRDKAQFLSVLYGDLEALNQLRQRVLNADVDATARQEALQALLFKGNPDLLPLLQQLLADRTMRGAAIRGLAAYPDPDTPSRLLKHYAECSVEEKADIVHTLASRPTYALALVTAMEQGKVPRSDVSAFTVRQMLQLKDKSLTEKLNEVWGVLRPASGEKTAHMSKYKALLTPTYLKQADLARGRLLYARHCASCHVLFGEGGKIGPELTGSQRNNLDYVLENLLDPSAVVGREYQVTALQTTTGRLITGIIKQENDKVVTVQTQNEIIYVPKTEIEERIQTNISMMPEGLLQPLKEDEVRDLIAYLASPTQVPLPEEKQPPMNTD